MASQSQPRFSHLKRDSVTPSEVIFHYIQGGVQEESARADAPARAEDLGAKNLDRFCACRVVWWGFAVLERLFVAIKKGRDHIAGVAL